MSSLLTIQRIPALKNFIFTLSDKAQVATISAGSLHLSGVRVRVRTSWVRISPGTKNELLPEPNMQFLLS